MLNGAAERWSPLTETMLMYAARADHLERTIRPALAAGRWVLCDRFADSSRAYQGAGGGVSSDFIEQLDAGIVGADQPDLTLIFDLPVEVGLARALGRGGGSELRFESKGEAFHQRLRAGFGTIAAAHPDRCRLIDATGDPDTVFGRIQAVVTAAAPRRRGMSEHPRDRFDLQPSIDAEAAFEDARQRGRLHHAWLLCGPEGVGKATFAYRAARRLLGAAPDPSRGLLGTRPDDPVSRLISAQSHPDLLVLERLVENGKVKKSISVDQARDLPEFFSKSPSQASARVAIVDAADDLNLNAANALLKVLEEPPEHGVLLLVTHCAGPFAGDDPVAGVAG